MCWIFKAQFSFYFGVWADQRRLTSLRSGSTFQYSNLPIFRGAQIWSYNTETQQQQCASIHLNFGAPSSKSSSPKNIQSCTLCSCHLGIKWFLSVTQVGWSEMFLSFPGFHQPQLLKKARGKNQTSTNNQICFSFFLVQRQNRHKAQWTGNYFIVIVCVPWTRDAKP